MLVAMPTAMTKAAHETAAGEGLALGLVALDVDSLNGSKTSVEFAFQRAWRDWTHRSRFPAVHADVARNDLLRIIDKSEGRRSAHLSEWFRTGRLSPTSTRTGRFRRSASSWSRRPAFR